MEIGFVRSIQIVATTQMIQICPRLQFQNKPSQQIIGVFQVRDIRVVWKCKANLDFRNSNFFDKTEWNIIFSKVNQYNLTRKKRQFFQMIQNFLTKWSNRAIWSEQQRHRLEINISASQEGVCSRDPFLGCPSAVWPVINSISVAKLLIRLPYFEPHSKVKTIIKSLDKCQVWKFKNFQHSDFTWNRSAAWKLDQETLRHIKNCVWLKVKCLQTGKHKMSLFPTAGEASTLLRSIKGHHYSSWQDNF